MVYESAEQAINFVRQGNTINSGLARCIQETINTSNTEMAEYIIKEFKLKAA